MRECSACHEKQAAAFSVSPMGRSVSRTVTGEGSFIHERSLSRFIVADGTQTIERRGLRAEYRPEFAIGSGEHAQGFVVRIGGMLFQSPAAAYQRQARWGVAPGYEEMTAPDFNRPVPAECLLCHSNGGAEVEAIGCERCHGDGSAHLRKPVRGTIVNPARLARAERDSVCEQCHLNGEARVRNPGTEFDGFRPGQVLEEAFSVFVFDRPAGGGLKVVSHVEQLAQSACQRATGKLWCGGCHEPHGAAVDVSAQCRGCHLSLSEEHPAGTSACTSCHMPKRPARDGGHAAFTDHRIQRRPGEEASSPSGLRAWRDPAEAGLRDRNLGLAYVMVGERDGSAEFLNRGYKLLAGVYPQFPKDADVLASLGMVLFVKDQKADAAKLLRAAIAARPGDAGLYEKLGVVLGSEAAFEKAIALEPSRESAYHLLADLQPTGERRRAVLERYLQFNPQSLIGREALGRGR